MTDLEILRNGFLLVNIVQRCGFGVVVWQNGTSVRCMESVWNLTYSSFKEDDFAPQEMEGLQQLLVQVSGND